jgi:hypothetical protein
MSLPSAIAFLFDTPKSQSGAIVGYRCGPAGQVTILYTVDIIAHLAPSF